LRRWPLRGLVDANRQSAIYWCMSGNLPKHSRPCVAVFDLDGTLTWRDTLMPFLCGYVLRHPARLSRFWRLPGALLAYLAGRDRGLLKSRVIGAVLGGEPHSRIERWTAHFVGTLQHRRRFRPMAIAALETHRVAGDHLVLLSASPDLYVPHIGRLLGFERTLCTELRWEETGSGDPHLQGDLRTPNRRGEEKSRCLLMLRGEYLGLPFIAYGNSRADLPHLILADRALLVNGNAAARRAAAVAGVQVADWT
jgi:phosphatidylglycerophosphatase C